MCDGARDETTWTIKYRVTGRPLETESGFGFSFTDEVDAVDFVHSRADASELEVAATPVLEV